LDLNIILPNQGPLLAFVNLVYLLQLGANNHPELVDSFSRDKRALGQLKMCITVLSQNNGMHIRTSLTWIKISACDFVLQTT